MVEYAEFFRERNKFLGEIAERVGIKPSLLPLTYREESARNPAAPGVPIREHLMDGFRQRMAYLYGRLAKGWVGLT